MKTYITGATGRLGLAVLKRIPEAIPLMRKFQTLGTGKGVVTDFSEIQLKRILKDADVLIHLAGSVDTTNEKIMDEANIDLTRRLMNSTPKTCKIIFASSVSVYGKKLAEIPANENTRTNPDSAYSKSKLAAEELVKSTHENHVILRISTIYGPGFVDYFRVLKYIEQGKMRIIGNGNNRIPFVHVEDAATAISNAVNAGKGTYIIAGDPLTQKEIYETAALKFGVPAPQKRTGIKVALLGVRISEFKARFTGKKPTITKEHIMILGNDRVFDCERAKKELDFKPRPLESGITEMVEEYKKQGEK